ncbi:MAG: type IV toxin-antitoxin system AbiEi family antitoxin domain-containing protein [Actinomycetota bacterium]|nr:type IV toxin-antitoxin system AbiEi family antitoxin domain-containing protein [Actinomycetota bacterium]
MRSLSDTYLPHESVDLAIARLAARQHSTFSREQVFACGGTPTVIRNRLRRGLWIRVQPGVYRLAGAAVSWRQFAAAALLAFGDTAALCRHSAAAVLELPDFRPLPVEIVVPRGRRKRLHGVRVHESSDLMDIIVLHGFRMTNATRTLIDVTGSIPPLKLEIATDDALRRRLTSLKRLRRRLDALGGSGRPGTRTLRGVLDERNATGIPQSPLETRTLATIRAAGIALPICQYEVQHNGTLLAVLDFAWPSRMVAVEADGYAVHSDKRSFENDRRRHRILTALGWRVVSVTSKDLDMSQGSVAAQIGDLLAP